MFHSKKSSTFSTMSPELYDSVKNEKGLTQNKYSTRRTLKKSTFRLARLKN